MTTDLFGQTSYDPERNILPCDGEVNYFGSVFEEQAEQTFQELLSLPDWQNDEVVIFGKHITTARKYAFYGDKPYSYRYAQIKRTALPWPDNLNDLREHVQVLTNTRFNVCLLNLYHSGDEGMGWHTDDEPELVSSTPIASVSFGAMRRFDFKHRLSKDKVSLTLDDGSLLLMSAACQKYWLHQLPKTKKVTRPRINLTFRCMNEWTASN